MKKRRPIGSASKEKQDPYLPVLARAWPTILRAYAEFEKRKPIVEYRLREQLVIAYPAVPYIDGLTVRTRDLARQQYRNASTTRRFMVFVHDSDRRVLKSYVFPVQNAKG